MDIAAKILELMKVEKISRYKLAKESGVPYTTLIKILDGTTKNPQINSLELLAQYFGVDVDDLIGSQDRSPEWATPEDKWDLKRMLLEDIPVMFDGVPIEGEARQRVMDVLTGLFWESRENQIKEAKKQEDETSGSQNKG